MSAPGKALLCGEYAVLEGAPAVVAAVERRAYVTWSDRAKPMPPEVEATLERVQAELGPLPHSIDLDVEALRAGEQKLGLGSSAAAASAAAGLAFVHHGHSLTDVSVRDRVFRCAYEGHASVAPQGSGVDVACSTYGGFLRFTRTGTKTGVEPLAVPQGLAIRLIWTGQPARTSDLVARVKQFEAARPTAHRQVMARLAEAAEAFVEAFRTGNAVTVVACAGAYGEAMATLGEHAGAPIVEARLRRTAELAAQFSGSAKPCGAGGGDVAVAFFTDEAATGSFEAACANEGLRPVDVQWGAEGVRADQLGLAG